MFRRPVARELIGFLVARKTCVQTFREEIVELGTQRINVADARRAGRHAVCRIFLELNEIKHIPVEKAETQGSNGFVFSLHDFQERVERLDALVSG